MKPFLWTFKKTFLKFLACVTVNCWTFYLAMGHGFVSTNRLCHLSSSYLKYLRASAFRLLKLVRDIFEMCSCQSNQIIVSIHCGLWMSSDDIKVLVRWTSMYNICESEFQHFIRRNQCQHSIRFHNQDWISHKIHISYLDMCIVFWTVCNEWHSKLSIYKPSKAMCLMNRQPREEKS